MYKQRRSLLFAGILFIICPVFSQRLGMLPPSIKWEQLTDDSLRILYPQGTDEKAERVAALMLRFASLDPINQEGRYRPITVVLQPQTNISNGYVGLAPYVSEFYLQPHENPFALGSLPWADLLAIHEYRHVQQVNAANTGISHLVKLIFGELAFTGMYNLAIPNWFREGDAVYGETKWTMQGRGRLSNFTLPFRMKLLEGEEWNYYKVRNGSYREFTPDHYPLGYLLVQYGNHLFGEETWDTIVHEAARFKHLIAPFSGAVKERTGYRNKHLYQHAMDWYREKWKNELEKDLVYPYVAISENDLEKDYFDMTFPSVDGDGTIYTAITTFDQTAAIYKITPDGKRKKEVSMGPQQDTYFDHSLHRIVWTELRYDPRWIRKDKNVIVVYDEETATKNTIEPEKGFYTPSLDKRAVRVAALHADLEGNYNIRILDARSGAQIASLPNPENLYLGYPTWTEDEKGIIAAARNKRGEMALVLQDIATGKLTNITHYSYHLLGKPRVHDHWILVASTQDDIDQVYAVDVHEGIFYQVSDGNKAHYDPCWDPLHDAIVCSQYQLTGKKLVRLPGDPRNWKMKNLGHGIKHVAGESGIDLVTLPVGQRSLSAKKYSQWFNALNFHSWTLTADDPVWGVEVRSNNLLNNIGAEIGYQYDRTTKAAGPYLDFRFGMWYPVISFGVSKTSREVRDQEGTEYSQTNDRLHTGVALPLYFSSGIYQQLLQVSSDYSWGLSKTRPKIEGRDDFNFNFLRHRITVINSRMRAYRQPLPTWGQRFDIFYSHEAEGVQISQLYASADFALPGLRASHFLMLGGEILSQDVSEGSIQLSSPYRGARGFDQQIGKTQYAMNLTYGFPVLYPDIGIGNIFYTRRIRLQPFYDVAYSKAAESDQQWTRSAGVELIADFDFPPVSVGIRYSRLLDGYSERQNRFEIFLPVERF